MLNGLKEYHLQQGPAGKAISGHSRREIPFLLRKRYESGSNSRTFQICIGCCSIIKDGPPPIVSRYIAESKLIHLHIYNKDAYFLGLDCNEKYYEEKLGPEI